MIDRSRRGFVRLATLAWVGASGANTLAEARRDEQASDANRKWDLGWLDSFRGRHKQVYDLLGHAPGPKTLNPPMNYLDVHREVSRLEFPDVNVVVGINSAAFPINASDSLWAKFRLGERYNITDPDTGKPAVRNVYLGPRPAHYPATVRELQTRGAVFMMCNNSLNAISNDWSGELGRSASDLHDELVAGLNPGVKVVPALTWAVGMLQERRFTYEKL